MPCGRACARAWRGGAAPPSLVASCTGAVSPIVAVVAATAGNVFFGVREHGMGAAVNGMAAHGGIVRPYGSTFLQFADYMRGSIRLSALQRARWEAGCRGASVPPCTSPHSASGPTWPS